MMDPRQVPPHCQKISSRDQHQRAPSGAVDIALKPRVSPGGAVEDNGLLDIVRAAPNVFATLNGHDHWDIQNKTTVLNILVKRVFSSTIVDFQFYDIDRVLCSQ